MTFNNFDNFDKYIDILNPSSGTCYITSRCMSVDSCPARTRKSTLCSGSGYSYYNTTRRSLFIIPNTFIIPQNYNMQ